MNYEQFIFDRISEQKINLKSQFNKLSNETSTRFFYIDNLLPKVECKKIYESFPEKDKLNLRNTFREKKYTLQKLSIIENKIIEKVTDAFQSKRIVNLISDICSIKFLEADPSLYAGGISRMDKSHFLNPHIDNSHNKDKTKYRRLNLLYYVTPNVSHKSGGNFELWDKNVKKPLEILSKFNRLIVMETTKTSWHSVSPVETDIKRCCLSNYFFTTTPPDKTDYYHVTSFLGRPNQKMTRIYGYLDNYLRQKFVQITGYSRGTKLTR